MQTYKLTQVLKEETELIEKRREKLFGTDAKDKLESEKFGIALSGGGIRSATINLGFLKTLNLFKILEKADYISTVSGGGYTGAYVQATVKQLDGYDKLFHEEKIQHLRSYGDYMIPGQGKIEKLWNTVLLAFGYLVSWIMSLLSPFVTVLIGYLIFKSVASFAFLDLEKSLLDWNYEKNKVMNYLSPALWALGATGLVHFVLNLVMNFNLNISKFFTKIESAMLVVIILFLLVVGVVTIDTSGDWSDRQILWALLTAAGLYFVGYILNPNSLSFHRFYRKQLADAFLSQTGLFSNMLLKNVFKVEEDKESRNYIAPYPLINTCLNLQNPGEDDKFKGAKASDYFLLSPLFCGSKLSQYVKTAEFPGFKHLTLPAALTISAAAVNPGMGIYSNKLLSVMMTLFNARLGFWVNNPSFKTKREKAAEKKASSANKETLSKFAAWRKYAVWWPSYFFKELFSKIGTTNRKLNISDGGHIENLAVYELLRRKCRLILAVDAGADPLSTFADLENLSIRARNELGIDVAFRQGQDPVESIRPKASSGYAQKRFVVADLMKVWEEFVVTDENEQPITYKTRYVENGVLKEVEVKLEALVNYFYSKKDKNILKFRVDLKAERGIDFTPERFDELHAKAVISKMNELNAMSNKIGSDKIKIGTLVYIKSSVTSPRKLYVPSHHPDGSKNPQFDTFKYKIYHPDFPHESTADQFFDPVQWESYFQLGQFIGTDILDAPNSPGDYQRGDHDLTIEQLIRHFDEGEALFRSDEKMAFLVDVSHVEEKPESMLPKKSQAAEAFPQTESMVVSDPELDAVKEENIMEQMQFKI
ncbi:MAG: hypothetical protein R2788_09690 [Saprospiraceae bacterium]